MLKLETQLWIYSPSTDRVIQISGHMLRQGDGTGFRVTSIEFDQDIPEHIFSRAALRQ